MDPKRESSSDDEEEGKDEMGALDPGLPMPTGLLGQQKPPTHGVMTKLKRCYDPMPWEDFFDRRDMLWDEVPYYVAGDKGPVFFCLHGAGLSALSFAALAREMKSDNTLVAFDWRGHGGNTMAEPEALSEENLITDALRVLKYLALELDEFNERSFIILGHSMGGAIASKLTTHIL